MRTLFSGEELNRFLDDPHDFKLPNGDMFEADDYFAVENFEDFNPFVVYDISKSSIVFRRVVKDALWETFEFSFADCFYAWCKQVGTDIQIEHEVFQGISDYLQQPEPVKNDLPAVWDLVIQDMQNRDKVGQERYGTRLQPHNGRDVLRDISEELLDALVYIRSLMYERDGK